MLADVEGCTNCSILREWLDKEIEEKEYFRTVLFNNTRISTGNPEVKIEMSPSEFHSVTRSSGIRMKRAKMEFASRLKAKGEHVVPAKDLTEAEKIFEKALGE